MRGRERPKHWKKKKRQERCQEVQRRGEKEREKRGTVKRKTEIQKRKRKREKNSRMNHTEETIIHTL